MFRFRPPWHLQEHRVAAIALFRALLTQCRAPAYTAQQRLELQNVVRTRFRDARRSQSHRQLRVSFEAGYEAIDHLDAAATGNVQSKDYIVALLDRAPERVKRPSRDVSSFTNNQIQAVDAQSGTRRQQDSKPSLFDRPLPLDRLSGKRHVPVLFSANGIPVLRVKKPQPQSLSGMIRNRVKQRQNRQDLRWSLTEDLDVAATEDQWEELVAENNDQEKELGGRQQESKWVDQTKLAIRDVSRRLFEEREKNRLMAVKMQGVVDRETELAKKDKTEAQIARRKRYVEKREAKRAEAHLANSASQDSITGPEASEWSVTTEATS